MIKLQGNTKIYGKAMFGIEPEVIAFSPEQITGLKGWYDYTYGVYRTNENDAIDDEYAAVSFLVNGAETSFYYNYGLTNGKNSYGGANGDNYLRWENNLWTLTYISSIEGNEEDGFTNVHTTVTATGDTQYPWQANWTGTGNNVTRVATTNSILATNNQTVAKWANKVGNLGNIYEGNMIQDTLASQPFLRTSGVELNAKRLSALFGVAPTAQRTYYVVGNGLSNSNGFNNPILASSSSTFPSSFRNALISRNVSANQKYGLSQGTAVSSSFSPAGGSTSQIICASFESAGSGKIKVNNQNEETLTGIGTNFSSASDSLFLGSTSSTSILTAKEILFYEGAHTTEQKNQVITYLNAKYNLF